MLGQMGTLNSSDNISAFGLDFFLSDAWSSNGRAGGGQKIVVGIAVWDEIAPE